MTEEIQSLSEIAARSAKNRGDIASLTAEIKRLESDKGVALFTSQPAEAVKSLDKEIAARKKSLADLELLQEQIDSRLPAEERDRLAAEYAAALAAEQAEDAKTAELQKAVIAVETQLAESIDAYNKQKAAASQAHGKCFSADNRIRAHRAAHPELYAQENAA